MTITIKVSEKYEIEVSVPAASEGCEKGREKEPLRELMEGVNAVLNDKSRDRLTGIALHEDKEYRIMLELEVGGGE